jgi:hypothetical protein
MTAVTHAPTHHATAYCFCDQADHTSHSPSNTGHIRAKVWDQFVHGLLSERLLRGSGIRLEDDPTRIGGSGDQPRVRPTELKKSAILDWPLSLRLPRAYTACSSPTEAPSLHPRCLDGRNSPRFIHRNETRSGWRTSAGSTLPCLVETSFDRCSAYRFLDPQNRGIH